MVELNANGATITSQIACHFFALAGDIPTAGAYWRMNLEQLAIWENQKKVVQVFKKRGDENPLVFQTTLGGIPVIASPVFNPQVAELWFEDKMIGSITNLYAGEAN